MSVEMNSIDLELKLLAGMDIQGEHFKLKPVKLGKIIEMGYTVYQYYLHILSMKPEDLSKKVKLGDNVYSLIMERSENMQLAPLLINAFIFFLQEDRFTLNDNLSITFGDTAKPLECVTIGKDNFEDFVEIVKYQNCLKSIDEKDKEDEQKKVTDSRVAKMMKRLKKAKEVVDEVKKKQNKGADITIASMISAVTAKSNTVSKFNFCDLTVYQLYDEYKRLQKISGYDVSILALVNGAKIDLDDWSSKI